MTIFNTNKKQLESDVIQIGTSIKGTWGGGGSESKCRPIHSASMV